MNQGQNAPRRKERGNGRSGKEGKKDHAAEEKLEIFLEVQKGNVARAEVMRRHGIPAAQLERIEKKAREALLSEFKNDRIKKDPENKALARGIERLKEPFTGIERR